MLDSAERELAFPSLREMTYLNTAAEGIPPAVVGEALARYFADKQDGSPARERHFAELESARALVAEMFGLAPNETAICSNSSEAFNLAAQALRLKPGDEVVINDLDFPAGQTPWLMPGCPAEVRVWRARQGALRIEDLGPLLSPRTRLVTTSLVSYYNGFRLTLPPLVEAVRRYSPALLAVDVTQALGRVPMDLRGADLIVSSTHKWILATHGGGLVGIPAARAGELGASAGGWFNFRDAFDRDAGHAPTPKPGAESYMCGMPNFPAVYAIRAALDYILAVGVGAIDAAARPLVHECLDGLAYLPVELLTPREDEALAGIIAFRHPDMGRLFAHLREERIHVMHSAGRMRVAIHGYNTPEDIEHLLRVLRAASAE